MDLFPFIIDGILILIFISQIFRGRRKGFFAMVFSLVATAVSVLISYEYSAPIAEWINDTFVQKAAVNALSDAISSHLSSGTQAVLDAIPGYITKAAEASGVTVSGIVSDIGSSFDVTQAAELIYAGIYEILIHPILYVVVFVAVYAISNAILSFGIKFFNNIFKLPVLKTLNKTFGGVVGALKGIVIVVILSIVLVVVAPILPEEFGGAINSSIIPNMVEEISLKVW